jgi:hypothetical protein
MDIRAEKLWLIDQIAKIQDERLLLALRSLLEFANQPQSAPPAIGDFWDELSTPQKQQIEKAIQELDEGKGIPHEAVMAEFRQRYQRRV